MEARHRTGGRRARRRPPAPPRRRAARARRSLRRLGVKTLQDFQNLSEQQKCYREYRAAATAAAARSRVIPQKAPAESDYDTGHSEIDLFDSDDDQNAFEKDF